jgi:general secretion pathway protein B
MSYILEALKKAQAERQLGSSPTIHAPTLQSAERTADGGRFKAPVVLALLGMAAVIGVLLTLVLRTSEPAAPAVAPLPPQGAVAPAPSVAAVVAASAPQPVAAVAAPAPAPLREPTPLPAPVADLPPSVAQLAKASASTPSSGPAAPVAASVAVVAKPAAAPEEPVMNLRDLPEPIQRSIPQVAVGGYIYSRNPADRVLLIDKVLRREGEEVAPGLTLEKLQPKEAVFNFKGYRYRVPY